MPPLPSNRSSSYFSAMTVPVRSSAELNRGYAIGIPGEWRGKRTRRELGPPGLSRVGARPCPAEPRNDRGAASESLQFLGNPLVCGRGYATTFARPAVPQEQAILGAR